MLLKQEMQLSKIKNFRKGFTMIELLVVVAIIGILSSIVLISVSTARAKGIDSFIQQNLRTVQTQAEIYFQNKKAYDFPNNAAGTTCSTAAGPGVGQGYNLFSYDPVIRLALITVMSKINNSNPPNTSFCGASKNSWVAAIRLKSSLSNNDSTDRLWCVDSNGQSKEITGPPWPANLSDGNVPPTFKCP